MQAVSALSNTAGYNALRYSPDFWQVSDRLHDAARAALPREYGAFDFNRLQAP